MMAKIRTAFSIIALLLVAGAVTSLRAQTDSDAPLLSPDDLQQLVAPIALYPDPLIALILPGSTVPTDIVLANRYVENGGDPDDIDSQNWDDSVKGLARYPDVLQMMDDNLDWTNQLGAAVLAQQPDVMAAIQAQRAKAEALGNLETTSQQQVINDGGIIQIVPANPQVIYVPVYDPQVIYVDRGPNLLNFGLGFAIGAWLSGDCDWHGHYIYRSGYYRPGYGWNRPVNIIINRPPVWRPNPGKPKPRPPYRPNRPGKPGNGHLPGWQRPPGGNKPAPGKPGRPGQVKPLPGNGNRPGGPGGNKPSPGNGNKPGGPGGNRPGGPGNRPGTDQPQIQPVPGTTKPGNRPGVTNPGTTKPGKDRPTKPVTRPAPTKPNIDRPITTQPHIQPKPRPQVQPTRPGALPTNRPTFNRDHPNTKRPEHQPAPAKMQRPASTKTQRPAPAKSAPAQRPAPAGKADKKR